MNRIHKMRIARIRFNNLAQLKDQAAQAIFLCRPQTKPFYFLIGPYNCKKIFSSLDVRTMIDKMT